MSEDILQEALRITTQDRNRSYGPPEEEFKRVAAMWSNIIGATVLPKHVALCMIALKINRALHSEKRDNWVDIAGYARCGYLTEENLRRMEIEAKIAEWHGNDCMKPIAEFLGWTQAQYEAYVKDGKLP